jgi:glyoxylase-like metal-dependent hydrolase (beta-lactamase superfamily II)/rhodanese-related sulfurtransferase
MELEIVVTAGLGNASYLVASGGEALVVDPPRDAWRLTSVAAARGWRITTVVETHVHNDYLSGALELRASEGARIVAPARGRYTFAHDAVDDGDEVRLGDVRLVARATPGHTPEHLAWDVLPDGSPGPTAVLTGGSLLVGSAGRTDLLGADRTDELTTAQFRSLRQLATLPDSVMVLPTHGTGSFCAAGPADAARTSTIGAERAHNPLLRAPEEAAFRSVILAGRSPYPAYYSQMAPINRAGPAVLGARPTPAALDPAQMRGAMAAGAHVVDARSRRAFAASHIPGSLGVELSDTFASYVGWLVPFAAPLVLVLPEPTDDALVEATEQLIRIGYDRIDGWLDGGIERYAADGGESASYATATARAVRDELGHGVEPRLLDVRDPNEWRDDGRVDGAIEIPLGELPMRLAELPTDAPITVMCKSGARASIAASMLDAAGYDVRAVGVGGALDLISG